MEATAATSERALAGSDAAREPLTLRIGATNWSVCAWGAIAAAAAFVALTWWWLTQDTSIPIYDAGDHLYAALQFHEMLQAGNWLGPFNYASPYPPLAALVGALATFVGGVSVAAPIVGENLVFVPLLVLGVYRTGRLLFDPRAGLLAALVALGSPLLIAQLHVFMFDAPETAIVAVTIWLLLASEDFGRLRYAVLAGVAIGAGMLIKVQFSQFVAGLLLIAVLRGGWREHRRNLGICAAIALLISVPWYLDHLVEFSTFVRDASPHQGVPVGDVPPTFSLANLAWYFWNILNSQLLLPLFLLLAGGTAWMGVTLARRLRIAWAARSGPEAVLGRRLEFFCGALVAWFLITLQPSHDIRYGIPLMPYIAVLATGWIVELPRPARLLASVVVVLAVAANTLGTTFGVGGAVEARFAHPLPAGEELADSVRIYNNEGFLVAGPRRDGDVPGLLAALRRDGVRAIAVSFEQSTGSDFSFEGLLPLAEIAHLQFRLTQIGPVFTLEPERVMAIHEALRPHAPPPCTRMSDGTGVWFVRYEAAVEQQAYFCPTRHPQYYDVGHIAESGL
jgi:4-amino-4-deoxy-L-arabinose transferase-like glycosyltransferase